MDEIYKQKAKKYKYKYLKLKQDLEGGRTGPLMRAMRAAYSLAVSRKPPDRCDFPTCSIDKDLRYTTFYHDLGVTIQPIPYSGFFDVDIKDYCSDRYQKILLQIDDCDTKLKEYYKFDEKEKYIYKIVYAGKIENNDTNLKILQKHFNTCNKINKKINDTVVPHWNQKVFTEKYIGLIIQEVPHTINPNYVKTPEDIADELKYEEALDKMYAKQETMQIRDIPLQFQTVLNTKENREQTEEMEESCQIRDIPLVPEVKTK